MMVAIVGDYLSKSIQEAVGNEIGEVARAS